MNDFILSLCAAAINSVTLHYLAFLKKHLFDKKFIASRLPHPAETCSGAESSVSVMLKDIPLSSNNLMLSKQTDAGTK